MSAVPTDPYLAADWLIARHPWLKHLVERVVGSTTGDGEWLDDLAAAVRDVAEHADAMRAYQTRHPPPSDDGAYERWATAGPQLTPAAHAFAVMSSGEKRIMRLLATLADTPGCWSVHDITGLDHRGAAIVADWLQIVRAQLPESLYRDTPQRLTAEESP